MKKINIEEILNLYTGMTVREIISRKEGIIAGWKDQLENKANPAYIRKYAIRCAVVGHIRRTESEIAALYALV